MLFLKNDAKIGVLSINKNYYWYFLERFWMKQNYSIISI